MTYIKTEYELTNEHLTNPAEALVKQAGQRRRGMATGWDADKGTLLETL